MKIHPVLQARFDAYMVPDIRKEIRLLDSLIAIKWDRGFFDEKLKSIQETSLREKLQETLSDMRQNVHAINNLCQGIPLHLAKLKENEEQIAKRIRNGDFTSRKALNRFKKDHIISYEKKFAYDLKKLKKRVHYLFLLIRGYLKESKDVEDSILSALVSEYLSDWSTSVSQSLIKEEEKVEEAKLKLATLNGVQDSLMHSKDSLNRVLQEIEFKNMAYQIEIERSKDTLNRSLNEYKALRTETDNLIYTKRKLNKIYLDSLSRLDDKLAFADRELKSKNRLLSQTNESLQKTKNDLENKRQENETLGAEKEALEAQIKTQKERNSWMATSLITLIIFLISNLLWAGQTKLKNNQLRKKQQLLEFYLKELPHRIKNNLQDISTLLAFQMDEIKHPEAKKALMDAQNRIQMIKLLHKHLYERKHMESTVNIRDYIHDLLDYISGIHKVFLNELELDLQIQNLQVDIDKAVLIGSILNELIVNCFEHAFPSATKPKLIVALYKRQHTVHIFIKDSGPGFSPDFSMENSQSFGLYLINMLVREEKGNLKFYNDNGACFEIDLPIYEGIYERSVKSLKSSLDAALYAV